MNFDFGGWMSAIFGLTFLVSIAIPILIIGVIVWAMRRSSGLRRDPAEEALRVRLARGEIDMAEFEVRLRALRDGDRS